MDKTEPAAQTRPPRQGAALAGVLLLALWLGWTMPALWAQQRPPVVPASSAQQVLEQIPAALLAAASAADTPLLLRGAGTCPCASPTAAPSTLVDGGHAAALPFEWIVINPGQRLVYAGPSLIPRACGTGSLSALPLITRLLAMPQPAVVLTDRCSCHQE